MRPLRDGAMFESLKTPRQRTLKCLYRDLDHVWNSRAASLNERLRRRSSLCRCELSRYGRLLPQPSRYNWMLQYTCAPPVGVELGGTGRLIFSLNYTAATSRR